MIDFIIFAILFLLIILFIWFSSKLLQKLDVDGDKNMTKRENEHLWQENKDKITEIENFHLWQENKDEAKE